MRWLWVRRVGAVFASFILLGACASPSIPDQTVLESGTLTTVSPGSTASSPSSSTSTSAASSTRPSGDWESGVVISGSFTCPEGSIDQCTAVQPVQVERIALGTNPVRPGTEYVNIWFAPDTFEEDLEDLIASDHGAQVTPVIESPAEYGLPGVQYLRLIIGGASGTDFSTKPLWEGILSGENAWGWKVETPGQPLSEAGTLIPPDGYTEFITGMAFVGTTSMASEWAIGLSESGEYWCEVRYVDSMIAPLLQITLLRTPA